jgi:L-rhamnose mutarotase
MQEAAMKRYGFLMKVKPELKAEYRKAHDEIWPEMAAAIRDSGIRNYSIYFLPDGTLFAYLESDDPAKSFELLGRTEVNARWQKAMDRFFVKKDPRTVGADVVEIEEVFHID